MGAVVFCVRSTVLYYIILQWIVFHPFFVSTQLRFHCCWGSFKKWTVAIPCRDRWGWGFYRLGIQGLIKALLTNPPDTALLLAVLRGWVNTFRFTSYQFGGHESMFFSFHDPFSKTFGVNKTHTAQAWTKQSGNGWWSKGLFTINGQSLAFELPRNISKIKLLLFSPIVMVQWNMAVSSIVVPF